MVVDKEIKAKICSLIRGIEREGYLSGWLVAVEQHRQQSPLPSERKACCCVVALAGWHSGQGSRVCNSTTISSVQEPCSTLAGVGPFWPSLLGLLAKIKCSICSYQLNI